MNNLLSLLQLSDPMLPIGGFAHSYGLETYVQNGVVHDKPSANEFITQMLSQNIHYTDAAFVSLAYDASKENSIDQIIRLDEECRAVKLPREIREASSKLGTRLLKIFGAVQQNEFIDQLKCAVEAGVIRGSYSVMFGTFAAVLRIEKADSLTGYYYNAVAGLVTNSVKLVPLGQQDGQEILFSLQPLIKSLVQKSLFPNRDLIGLCCTGFDIRCMQHERLYSRLYMS